MSSGFLSERVVHLHPTLRCNLACHHCYSSSAPYLTEGLDLPRVLDALALLAAEGYTTLSLSGGEPLLYPGFSELVRGAAARGVRVNVVTNGTVLSGPRLGGIAELLSFVAVSVDGAPERHDRIRGRDGTFAHTQRGLALLRETGVSFLLA